MKIPDRQTVLEYRQKFTGANIKLISMRDDQRPLEPGLEGVVNYVDDIGTLHMKWENGRTLGLIVGRDQFEVLDWPVDNTPSM